MFLFTSILLPYTSPPQTATIQLTIFDRVNCVQDLFEIVPPTFFSLLASKNKHIYFRALMVLRDCYQGELRFKRGDLVAYLVDQLMSDLLIMLEDSDEDSADLATAELTTDLNQSTDDGSITLSGRAHALVRRLLETGWLEAVPDEDSLDELILVPDYAIAFLDVLYNIVHPVEKPYNSYVYSTYSVLRTANEERDYMYPALQSAYENIHLLLGSLRSLLHNIHRFYQSLQKRRDIHELLAEHFDEYQVLVAAKTYHPLKTVDSVYRFRPRILSILRDWLQDGEVLEQMVQSMQAHQSRLEAGEARYEVIRMIQFIIDSLETMNSFLHEIDKRNSAYSRASVERIQYLLNTDRDTKGKLVEILKQASEQDKAQPSKLLAEMDWLPIFRVEYADSDGLFTEPTRRERGKPQPLKTQDKIPAALFAAEAEELIERANSLFSHARIVEFILAQMSPDGMLQAQDLRFHEIEDYLRTMVAVIKADEPDIPYRLAWDDTANAVVVSGYRIPALMFLRTNTKQP